MYVAGQSLEKKSNKKKIGAVVVGVALTMSVAVYGISAYLTDTKEATNKFSVDTDFKIELSEPDWVDTDSDTNGIPDAAENLAPTQTIAKDPTVKNASSKMNAWVAMTVKVPVFTGKMADSNGKWISVTDQDLYSYTLKTGWSEVGTATVADGYRTHTYVYADELAPNATATVFDDITVANLMNNPQIKATSNEIVVSAHGIQKEGFTTAAAAYAAYVAQQTPGTTV